MGLCCQGEPIDTTFYPHEEEENKEQNKTRPEKEVEEKIGSKRRRMKKMRVLKKGEW